MLPGKVTYIAEPMYEVIDGMNHFPQVVLEAHHFNPRSSTFENLVGKSEDYLGVRKLGSPEMPSPLVACISHTTTQFVL
jgi:hypothetical protein